MKDKKGSDKKMTKRQKKRSPDWQQLLAILISILIMLAQYEATRLGAVERPNGSHHEMTTAAR